MRGYKSGRRGLALLLCLLLLLSLVSCSSRPDSMRVGEETESAPPPTEETPASAPAEAQEAPAEETEEPAAEEAEEPAAEPESPAEEPAPEAEPPAEAAETEEAAPAEEAAAPGSDGGDYMIEHDPWLAEATPEARAAARGLPAPPEVDLTGWEFNLANSNNCIGEYRPNYGYAEGVEFDARAADAAGELMAAARAAGYGVYAHAGYIGYEVQGETRWLPKLWELGAWGASRVEFGAGTSDHQTALALDVMEGTSGEYDPYQDFTQISAYQWFMEHCADYGFIYRYPEGKEYYYGLACRHGGHFRYVGQEAARYIMDNDLCLEEFMMIIEPTSVFIPSIGWDELS